MNGSELYTPIMLGGGIVLFIAALICLFRRFSATLTVTLFILAIIMIVFPRVKSFKVGGAEVNLGDLIEEQENNPDNPEIKTRLEKALVRCNSMKPASASPQLAVQVARGNEILHNTDLALNWAQAAVKKDPGSAQARELVRRLQLKQATPANADDSVSPQEVSKLTSAVSDLKQQRNLSAESHIVLSKAQLAFGQHDDVAANLNQALRQKPNVTVDPKLRALVAATFHEP